jgi:acyl carrier protein
MTARPGESTEQAVIDLLREKFGGEPSRDDSLALLELDSLGMAELSVELEKCFAIRVSEGIMDATTVGELIDYIDGLRNRTGYH